ncbi:MAG TPA: class I SAM-dependent methyltransferase [Bryobacteraceae bacterium]|jgi:SAM-dependent methyltransferase|nr:class I SAM-dependent methyltransferase [Bryobacteraceae bacterium]
MSHQQCHPPVSPIEGEVRDFYDRYPYPRPIDSLEKYRRLWQDQQRRRADHHLCWPGRAYKEEQSILVAGCGTSQAAKHALRRPAAHVTGIDLSATSVRCTEELKRRYSLDNLEVRQLPIERIDELGLSFDQIVCTGVLHHLADPDAGLAALRRVLTPDGAMHLMVYAPYGRRGVYMLQEFCRAIGIHATDEGIRELISALSWLPPGHPLENLLREAPDFQNAATLADALLHPQDRAYSVTQLFDLIEKAELTFGRWVRQAPYSPSCGVLANIPRLKHLSPPQQYAAAELFRGTMVRHSMVVYRKDNPDNRPQLADFSGDAWLRYVPVRMSDTICVQERLPPGAAAVLINQTHTCKDLLMPIDLEQKCLFDAIDGSRSIAGIAARALPSSSANLQHEVAANFFERLWHYDQVVFDLSEVHKVSQEIAQMVQIV